MAGMIDRLADRVNTDAALVRRGRYLSTRFLVGVGDTDWLIAVHEGRIDGIERGPFLMREYAFSIRAASEVWQRHWEPEPAAGYHDLLAMAKCGHVRIEGDLRPLMANLRWVKDVLALPRPSPPSRPAPELPEVEPVVGRYRRIMLDGRAHRIYWEEAGQGIPLVCLHTAGADGRQWRYLMNDDAITRDFRVLAFDMPWHGKSLPPTGWENEEYRLTTESYIALIRAFCRVMALERPVVLGCSIGGKIVLELARLHADEFRALIGVESAAWQPPWYDDTGWLHRSDVHGGEIAGAMMSGLIAPQSPAETRWDTLWMYMQGGPGVFRGDLYFYRADGDFRERVGQIDTRRCPLHLLTGEYDFSCTPDDTRRTAEKIPGARVTIMPEIGHFPMSEHPEQFRRFLLPVLEEIRAKP